MDKIEYKAKVGNLLDGNGYVEYYTAFAKANLNEANRIEAITNIAAVCYQNPKALNSESLYNRLLAESAGLPSSSFEFVPVLLTQEEVTSLYFNRSLAVSNNNPITKFGEWVEDGKYLLTNFRAVLYLKDTFGIDLTKRYNTVDECKIIAKHYKVFKLKVDLATRAQIVRHRVNWQELSRRYVSGNKVAFDFYESEKMSKVQLPIKDNSLVIDFETLIRVSQDFYNKALEMGIKPEEARRILPQAMYTQIWGGFQPSQLDNFFKLRLHKTAQKEIQEVAQAMHDLVIKA